MIYFLFSSIPGGKVGVLPILKTLSESNASAADQQSAKRWNTTVVALAKHRRSTAFQCWQTTNICVMLSIGAALDEHRHDNAFHC